MKRIIIAGTHSGCGKTTVTCAVLQVLCDRGMNVASFKCGPDYIDPMFHEKIIGTSAYNLDSFFCDDNTLKYLLSENSRNADISVIEGVMGFYDGADGRGSAYSASEITDTGAVIVIDCKGQSHSIGAVMKGFLTYRKNKILGFIFNRLPEKLVPMVKALCRELNTQFLGFMPTASFTLESRRLGLIMADEIDSLKEKMHYLGALAEKHIYVEKILELAENTQLTFPAPKIDVRNYKRPPVIAIARDSAFCFLYSENIDLLKKLGCEIRFFSPISDSRLPDSDGLILCGGYPELYAEQLSENIGMLSDIRAKIEGGMPIIAECGGFMYLHAALEKNGRIFRMSDVISGKVFETGRLKRFGYAVMTAEKDSLLCKRGEKIRAHEFHYWDSTDCGDGFTAEKSDGRKWKCVHTSKNLYAGFPHLYFYSDVKMAKKYVKQCAEYGGICEKN